jgi:hypothetical protein
MNTGDSRKRGPLFRACSFSYHAQVLVIVKPHQKSFPEVDLFNENQPQIH